MKRPYIVGIAGGSASGKSSFAKLLAESLAELEVIVVSMDAYFRAEKPLHTAPLSGRQWPDFNQPGSFHLDRLIADLGSCNGDVVILEGLMTLCVEDVRRLCALRVFIDAAPDERIVRRLRRNMARGLCFDDIADYYLESVRFRHNEFVEPSRWRADLVINGSAPFATPVEIIAGYIKERVRSS